MTLKHVINDTKCLNTKYAIILSLFIVFHKELITFL